MAQKGQLYVTSASFTTLPILIAQVVGITTAGVLFVELTTTSKEVSSLSYFTVPPLLNSPPALLARQWRMIYERSKSIGPPTVLISSLCFGSLAYVYRNMSSALGVDRYRSPLFLTAGVITVSVLPYTSFVMQNATEQLKHKVEDMEARVYPENVNENNLPKGQSTKELVDAWATLNFFRGCFPLVGAVLAVTARLGFDWMGLADYRFEVT